MSRHVLLATTVLLFTAACGPSQTAREQEDEQEQVYIREQAAKLGPLEGCYTGYIRPNREGGTSRVVMQLSLTTDTVLVPGRNKYVESPTLFGNVELYPEGDVLANFNKTVMNSFGHLVTSSSLPSTGGGVGIPAGQPAIDIAPDKDRFGGTLFMPGLITHIRVKKSNNPDDCVLTGGIIPPDKPIPPICKHCGPQ